MEYTNASGAPPLDPSQLRTGDLVLFHGDGHWTSSLIELSGNTPWSHVTLAVEYQPWASCAARASPEESSADGLRQTAASEEETRIGLWEATSWHTNQREVLRHQLRGGARLVDLEERLSFTNAGTVGVRQLVYTPHERNDLQSRIQRFIGAEDGKPYEPSWWPLIRSWFDVLDALPCMQPCLGRNPRSVSAYFCSELVAETLMQANVLLYTPHRPSAEFTVADFANLSEHDLVPSFRYGPVRPLVWSPPSPPLPASMG